MHKFQHTCSNGIILLSDPPLGGSMAEVMSEISKSAIIVFHQLIQMHELIKWVEMF